MTSPFSWFNAHEVTSEKEFLFKNLDLCRRTVEAFDRSMIAIRQIFFIALSVIVAGLTNVLRDTDLEASLIMVNIAAYVVVAFSIILWRLDSHYHNYMIEAIRTCKRIEEELGFDEKNGFGVTTNLEKTRDKGKQGKAIVSSLYYLPSILAGIGSQISTMIFVWLNNSDDLFSVLITMALITANTILIIVLARWTIDINYDYRNYQDN